MSERNEGTEQLSEEEIVAQVQELMVALKPYNNLKSSVLHNQHYATQTLESDPSLVEGDDEEAQYFRDAIEKNKRFTKDLQVEMANVGLKAEDGYAYRDIATREERRIADLIFLREFFVKMQDLYKRLHYKNGTDGEIRWDQQTLGTAFEEGKN